MASARDKLEYVRLLFGWTEPLRTGDDSDKQFVITTVLHENTLSGDILY